MHCIAIQISLNSTYDYNPKQRPKSFEGVIFDVYQWEQELFDGSTTTFEMLKRPGTVYVIAIDSNDHVVIQQEE